MLAQRQTSERPSRPTGRGIQALGQDGNACARDTQTVRYVSGDYELCSSVDVHQRTLTRINWLALAPAGNSLARSDRTASLARYLARCRNSARAARTRG